MSRIYDPILFPDREAWLAAREGSLGGSDASAVLGKNPYMTNEQLWEIKTFRRQQPDISDNGAVRYGIEAEDHLRELFKLDCPDYYVGYKPNNLFINPDMPWAHASLDGWLVKDGKTGILEIKTAFVNSRLQAEKWRDHIPDAYYCQILHYLMVTGWDFAVLKAQLKHQIDEEFPYLETRHYIVRRHEVEDEIAYLMDKEREFWKYVVDDRRPAVLLPDI